MKDRIAELREKNPADEQPSVSETESDNADTESRLGKEGTLASGEPVAEADEEVATDDD